MATNGVVSVTEKGQVIAKVVVGCDGYNAMDLAVTLRDVDQADFLPPTIYRLVKEAGFGCSDCLVVMVRVNGKVEVCHESDEDLGQLYGLTFDCAFFNPRWSQGIADHVVKLEKTTGEITEFSPSWNKVDE